MYISINLDVSRCLYYTYAIIVHQFESSIKYQQICPTCHGSNIRDGTFDGCLCFCVVEMVTTALELVGQTDRLGIRFQIDTDVLIIISFHCTTTMHIDTMH